MGYDVSYSIIFGIQLDITQDEWLELDYTPGAIEITRFGCGATGQHQQYFAFAREHYQRFGDSCSEPTFEAISLNSIDNRIHFLNKPFVIADYSYALQQIGIEKGVVPIKTIGEWDWFIVSNGG